MIHAYGVARAPVPVPGAPGVDGARLRAVQADHLAAVVSDHAGHPRPTGPRLVDHERVLQALLPHGVVPVRYGAALPDDATVKDMLAGRARELHRLLDKVRGRLEMGVRVALPTCNARPVTGRAYLSGKLDRQRMALRLADDLHHALGPLAVGRRLLATSPDLRVAYLVEAERVADFRERIQTLPGAPAEVVCTGPWPAYSFVTEDQP